MIIKFCFGVILILELVFIIRGNKRKEEKYFKISNGLYWGLLPSLCFFYFYAISDIYSYDGSGWIAVSEFFAITLFFIINVIIGLVNFILRKKSKKKQDFKQDKKKGTIFKTFLLTVVISLLVILLHLTLRITEKTAIDSYVKKEAMIYLGDKYGTNEFEILEIDRNFADSGFIETDYLENYEISIMYVPEQIEFQLYLNVDGKRNVLREESYDDLGYLLFDLYFKNADLKNDSINEIGKLTTYLETKGYNVEINLRNDYYDLTAHDAIDNNYGKMPTEEEFYDLVLDYHLKHELEIQFGELAFNSNDYETELRLYLVELSNNIIEYYGELNDFEVHCSYKRNNKQYGGRIIVNTDYVEIAVGPIEDKIER